MSDEELADTLGFFAGMGALAFAVGAFGGIVYGLLWVFGNYGVLGIIASLMVGGAFVSLSSLAIAEWRGVA